MLELPSKDPTSPLLLADWLEISALLSPDHNSSWGDLERVLRRAAFSECSDDEAVERKVLDTFDELEQRSISSSEAYPFTLDYGVLTVKRDWRSYATYTFCLCISYFKLKETAIAPKLFEQLSCLAAKQYLRGQVIGFGAPRKELPRGFADAVTEMCSRLREGERFRPQPELDRQDDTLDLVAWIDFEDKLPSKIILFGQCAAGQNWEDKLGELNPSAFCSQWMQKDPLLPPLRSFFMPHRVERTKWELVARKGGILFDRCRIAYWAHKEQTDYQQHIGWIENTLSQVML